MEGSWRLLTSRSKGPRGKRRTLGIETNNNDATSTGRSRSKKQEARSNEQQDHIRLVVVPSLHSLVSLFDGTFSFLHQFSQNQSFFIRPTTLPALDLSEVNMPKAAKSRASKSAAAATRVSGEQVPVNKMRTEI
jgi:hypothetical protein